MMKSPDHLFISVVVPTCHRNDLLAHCLDNLAPMSQTFPAGQYEVIVTDDGSNSTAERMISERYPWAKWVQGPRKGRAANRNHGTAHATGDWIAFVDDDCIPSPEWLDAYATAVEEDTFVYEGRTTCKAGVHSPLYTAPVTDHGGWLWSCNMMISRSLFINMAGFDQNFSNLYGMEDIDLRERLKSEGFAFPFIAGAEVDHPPRRLAWGNKLAASRENEVMFWYKRGNQGSPRRDILHRIVKGGLIRVRDHPKGLDSLLGLVSLCVEVVLVSAQMSRWENAYRNAGDYPTPRVVS